MSKNMTRLKLSRSTSTSFPNAYSGTFALGEDEKGWRLFISTMYWGRGSPAVVVTGIFGLVGGGLKARKNGD
jgi:hypothetical protein